MGRIVNGKYIKDDSSVVIEVNSQHGEYSKDRQREDNARDIIQPYINGQPNPEFAAAYPGQAKSYFTDDQLNNM